MADTPDKAAQMHDDWDTYGGVATTAEALETAQNFTWLPLPDGGFQLEAHAGGCDFELQITGDGAISGVSLNRILLGVA